MYNTKKISAPITFFLNGVKKLSVLDYQHKIDKFNRLKEQEELPKISMHNWLEGY